MVNNRKDSEHAFSTLFPVNQPDGRVVYYTCDFSEELGGDVYKGYQCTLIKSDVTYSKPCRIAKKELDINKDESVAIKLYDGMRGPSPYQFYASEIATFNMDNRDVLIMDFVDGFHIYPALQNNPQLKQLTFFQAVDIAWQLILGLNHLHYNNTSGPSIVHGDIKGENIKIIIKRNKDNKYKIDVSYLDLDYAKPIVNRAQDVEGTLEHVALELLDGYYSEASDFFALSPLLLSIFGAHNPLQKVMEFRDSHPHMEKAKLVRKFRDIDFCVDGLFAHFDKKAEPFVCQLLQRFILKMGAKNRQDRPAADAILEFFTALRQLCLADELKENRDGYLLRLLVIAQDEHWLIEPKYQRFFFNLAESQQHRLMVLMNLNQSIPLYRAAREQGAPVIIVDELRKKIAGYLGEASLLLKPPSRLGSIFFSPVTQKEVQWLLDCYEHHDAVDFYSAKNEKTRMKLEQCTEKAIAPLVAIVAEGIIKPAGVSELSK